MRVVGSLHDTRPGTLRLVGGSEDRAPAPRPDRGGRRAAIARENISAAALDLEDARLVFALRVADRLDAGRAAVLTPEKRSRLMKLSARMGLEPFDASLVIAIVQDAARRGEATGDPLTTGRLKLVKPAARRTDAELLMFAASVILAAIAIVFAVSWLSR